MSIHSAEEQNFVAEAVLDKQESGWGWIGGYNLRNTRQNFVWSDGSEWDFSMWSSGLALYYELDSQNIIIIIHIILLEY